MLANFPNLKSEGYEETSEATIEYNCIAWAAGENDRHWEPDPFNLWHWPDSAPREYTVDALCAAFRTLGYQRCSNGDLERGYEKIAIYAANDVPQHAAKQLSDGRWSSKLGDGIDISHTLRGLEGGEYGSAAVFMRRKVAKTTKRKGSSKTKKRASKKARK